MTSVSGTDEAVLLADDLDGVRTLTLNRPHRKNAITPELWVALRDALDAADRDRAVRALVLTGAGGSFCSGADISVKDDVKVAKGDKGWEMSIDYEASEPLFGNLYMTMAFNKTVVIN